MNLKNEDVIDTNLGFLIVQAPITFISGKFKGRVIYWLQDLYYKDLVYWDNELEDILTSTEKRVLALPD